jgi:hypothetical protein
VRLRGLLEVLRVELDEVVPVWGDFIVGVDGFDGAFVDAVATVDADVGVDEELGGGGEGGGVFARMDAVDGADFDAGGVFAVDTGLGDDVGHGSSLEFRVVNGEFRMSSGHAVIADGRVRELL